MTRLEELENANRDLREALAASESRAEKAEAALNPAALSKAWKKYTALLGVVPHGTEKQMAALLALVPVNATRVEQYALAARVAELEAVGKALVERWDAPNWKDVQHTGRLINDLRLAIDCPPAQCLAKVRAAAVSEALALIEPGTEYWGEVKALKEQLEAEAARRVHELE